LLNVFFVQHYSQFLALVTCLKQLLFEQCRSLDSSKLRSWTHTKKVVIASQSIHLIVRLLILTQHYFMNIHVSRWSCHSPWRDDFDYLGMRYSETDITNRRTTNCILSSDCWTSPEPAQIDSWFSCWTALSINKLLRGWGLWTNQSNQQRVTDLNH
jgi:hypothetical protein